MTPQPLPQRQDQSELYDVLVAVKNNGPIPATLYYDGKPWEFPVKEIKTVPYLIANYFFAVEIRHGKLYRNTNDYDEEGQETWYRNRLASYEPKGLMDFRSGGVPNRYENKSAFEEFRNWFKNGLEFALVPRQVTISPDLFGQLPKPPPVRKVAA